jgi:hypothetical protein
LTRDELAAELSPGLLAGLAGADHTRGEQLLAELIDYWLAEARSAGELADDVLRILRGDLERDVEGRGPEDRLALLEADVLDRELRGLSVESYALGTSIVDGEADDDDARSRGRALMARADALSPRVAAIALDDRRAALRRQLEDVLLEALFAVERGAASLRLGRYAQSKSR